jgi:hypothetical protein
VGIDQDGVYWRTRRKNTPGWKVAARLVAKTDDGNIPYVIETRQIL